MLGLNDTQESTLGLIFHWADQQGLPLLDLKDLRSVIMHLTSDEGKAELKTSAAVSSPTAGVILRALVNLEAAGRRHVLRRARTRPRPTCCGSTRTAAASSPCSSSATRPPAR